MISVLGKSRGAAGLMDRYKTLDSTAYPSTGGRSGDAGAGMFEALDVMNSSPSV